MSLITFLRALRGQPQRVKMVDLFAEHGLPEAWEPLTGPESLLVREGIIAYDYHGPWWQPGPVGSQLLAPREHHEIVEGDRVLALIGSAEAWVAGVVQAVDGDALTISGSDGRPSTVPRRAATWLPPKV